MSKNTVVSISQKKIFQGSTFISFLGNQFPIAVFTRTSKMWKKCLYDLVLLAPNNVILEVLHCLPSSC